jgi:hypothetical protein
LTGARLSRLTISGLTGLPNHRPPNRRIPHDAQFLMELEAVKPYALIRLVHRIVRPGSREPGQKQPTEYQPDFVHCFL